MCTPPKSARRIKHKSVRSRQRCAPRRQRTTARPRNRRSVGGADLSVIEEGGVRIVKVGPMGPSNNNAYLVRDVSAGETLLVDMPLEEGPLLEAIAAEGNVRTIVATHWH